MKPFWPTISRRLAVAGIAASMATRALSEAPKVINPPPKRGDVPPKAEPHGVADEIIAKANLGGVVGFAVADAVTGETLEVRNADQGLPPASTLKTITSIYALQRLGGDFRFATRVLATGPLINGEIDGDLILAGGGDPTLDTDRLMDLAIAVREAGVTGVRGKFLVWAGALPRGDRIDADQPEYVSYNPAFSGLNLNYNRVHFEWKPVQDGFEITMQARAQRFSPATSVAKMAVIDRPSPVYEYRMGDGIDNWSVAKGALGKKDGARWLPVRFPEIYTADVFRTLARSNGIDLKAPEFVDQPPKGSEIARTESDLLPDVIRDMLKYSTNLTAEAAGLAASLANGVEASGLLASGSRMAGWTESRFGVRGLRFRDHSGLGYESAISASDMVQVLARDQSTRSFLKSTAVPNPRTDNRRDVLPGASAVAKTGTLNFVSSLVGYLTTPGGRELVFAILTADTDRRDSIPPEQRESPPGSRSWANRSRVLQKSLLAHWALAFDQA